MAGNSTGSEGISAESWLVELELTVWIVALDSLLRVVESKSLSLREEAEALAESFDSFELLESFCLPPFFAPWNMPLGKSATAMAMVLMSATNDPATAEMGSHGWPSVSYSRGCHLK